MQQMRCATYLNDGTQILSTSFKLKKESIEFILDDEIIKDEPLSNIFIIWGISLKGLNNDEKRKLIMMRFGL